VRRLFTPRWVLVHVAVLVIVVAFLRLGWWQVQRAADGNLLSYGYAVQWPVFAGFVVFVWIKEMRDARRQAEATPEPTPPRRRTPHTGPAYDDTDDAELAAYNRYLTWLNTNPHASRSDYPG
jgi:DNA-binding transcriptional regulator of glucitol operon